MTARPPDGSAQADSFAQAHARLLADSSIQFDLDSIQPVAQQPPNWLKILFDFLNSPAMTTIFWILVALGAIVILYHLVLRVSGWSPPWRRTGPDRKEIDLLPEPASARRLLEEADLLALEGRFSDAAHLLLFRSLDDIDDRRPGLLRPALTSRDIAALPGLPDRPRAAFGEIAMMVERSLFAMRALTRADWLECRSAYERFAFAEGWQG